MTSSHVTRNAGGIVTIDDATEYKLCHDSSSFTGAGSFLRDNNMLGAEIRTKKQWQVSAARVTSSSAEMDARKSEAYGYCASKELDGAIVSSH